MKNLIILGTILIYTSFSIGQNIGSSDSFTDPRDGKIYKTIRVGNQIWMAENLNFETQNSWCSSCEKYGRIYNFEEAKTSAPPGWHLPSNDEWKELIDNLGGEDLAGEKMKSKTLWKNPNNEINKSFNGTDDVGFFGTPSPKRTVDGKIRNENYETTWWTSSEEPDNAAWTWNLSYNSNSIVCLGFLKQSGFSIRCIKDYIETTSDVSKDVAIDYLKPFEKLKEYNTFILYYISKSAEKYNALLVNPNTKIESELFQSAISAYAVDSTILIEIDMIHEVDSTLNLKEKSFDYYRSELLLIKEFNNYFLTITQNKEDQQEIELIRKRLLNNLSEMTKNERRYKMAEKHFKQKYKIEI
jgi:uncharacterized protein (TIGR02145 family)